MTMDKQTMINNLNKDLANELSAIIQYITYAAKVSGPGQRARPPGHTGRNYRPSS